MKDNNWTKAKIASPRSRHKPSCRRRLLPSLALLWVLALGLGLVQPAQAQTQSATPGSVVAWGYNGARQLNVPSGLVATAVDGGAYHSLALRSDGTGATDMVFGLLGANTINGLGGSDLLCGGNGVDTLNGGDGDDTLGGNRGSDVLNGEGGSDLLTGGQGGDRFGGGPGTDSAADFAPSQGDTEDGSVEGVTVLAGGMEEPALTNQIYLPAVQR